MKPLIESGLKFGEPVKKMEIFASTEETCNLISILGNVANYYPFCKANPVYRWPCVGYDLNIRAKISSKSAKVSWRIDENENENENESD